MLLDTNIVIYAAQPEHAYLRAFIETHAPSVSIITRIETLGYHRLRAEEKTALEAFFEAADVLPVTDDVADRAVALRQRRRLSLGDSLIAATALASALQLVTHNVADFAWIDGLEIVDPVRQAG